MHFDQFGWQEGRDPSADLRHQALSAATIPTWPRPASIRWRTSSSSAATRAARRTLAIGNDDQERVRRQVLSPRPIPTSASPASIRFQHFTTFGWQGRAQSERLLRHQGLSRDLHRRRGRGGQSARALHDLRLRKGATRRRDFDTTPIWRPIPMWRRPASTRSSTSCGSARSRDACRKATVSSPERRHQGQGGKRGGNSSLAAGGLCVGACSSWRTAIHFAGTCASQSVILQPPAAPTSARARSRSTNFCTLPVDGGRQRRRTRPSAGTLKCASWSRQKAMISSRVASASGLSCTNAHGVSPHFSSGCATTAATGTAGCRYSAILHLDRRDVLAAGDDDVLRAVLDLHVAVGCLTARSPVWNQPPRERRVGRLRVLQIAVHHGVAAHHDLADRLAVARAPAQRLRIGDASPVERRIAHALPRHSRRPLAERELAHASCGAHSVEGPCTSVMP